ncbi:DUF4157 domain-containing protein [Nocardia panacis]|uniref:DUF4157 domain-containing protein n=1 Tax=Nocardia panacis TaxID=2340916 RepID=A0A3A4KRE5_9NOCA|nr:DUF4157 domain-containing protein [Nocardia panacis]RJO78430.1 DUF4157 domain-containing protein [Nocardia panacis]
MAGFLGARQAHPTTAPAIVHEVLRSRGEPLDERTRTEMGARFGSDFSRVRVHSDGRAAESAAAVGARAYTVGRDVVFAAGQYAPGTTAGQETLTHELAHVVQRGTAPVRAGARIEVAGVDHPLETAARAHRPTAAAGAHPVLLRQTPPGGGAPPAPPRRIIYLDAEILDAQLGRNNTGVANALQGLRAAGAELRISQWTYHELVNKPTNPQTVAANKELVKDLGFPVDPSFVPVEERVDILVANQVGGTTVLSPNDAQLVAAAKRVGGEVFSTDRAFRNNARSVEKQLGCASRPKPSPCPPRPISPRTTTSPGD